MTPPARLRDAYKFFLPLIFMAEMMTISHSVIHAALARMEGPQAALASFSVGFATHNILGSLAWALPFVTLAFLRDKATLRSLVRFNAAVMLFLVVEYCLVGLTPVGDFVYGTLLGASPEVVWQAKWVTFILLFQMPGVLLRSLVQAAFMLHNRTILITVGTGMRVGSLFVTLPFFARFMRGGLVGAMGQAISVHAEAYVTAALAWRYFRNLPEREGEGEPPGAGAFIRFGWPLLINMLAEHLVVFAINFFLGRLPSPDRALAAFGVLNGLVRLLLSPVRNLAHTAQTLGRTREARRMLLRFAAQIVLFFSALLYLLFYTRLSAWVLGDVMGLNVDLSAYIQPGLLVTLATGLAWGYSALFRGLLSAERNTAPIANASALRLVAVTAFGGAMLLLEGVNGAVFGVLALTLAFGTDVVVMGLHLSARQPAPADVPPTAAPEPGTRPAERAPAGRA